MVLMLFLLRTRLPKPIRALRVQTRETENISHNAPVNTPTRAASDIPQHGRGGGSDDEPSAIAACGCLVVLLIAVTGIAYGVYRWSKSEDEAPQPLVSPESTSPASTTPAERLSSVDPNQETSNGNRSSHIVKEPSPNSGTISEEVPTDTPHIVDAPVASTEVIGGAAAGQSIEANSLPSNQPDGSLETGQFKGELRTWHAHDGRKSEATLVGYRSGTIELETPSGSRHWLAFARLSKEDCRFVIQKLGREDDDRAPLNVRTWSDTTGKSSTKAALLEVRDERVYLLKVDGQLIDVDQRRLGPLDLEFLSRLPSTTLP